VQRHVKLGPGGKSVRVGGRGHSIPAWVLALPPEDRFPGWPNVGGATASTLLGLSASLKRIYSDDVFDYAQNFAAPLADEFDEAKEITPEGNGYYWPFFLASPQNIGTPAEDGNIPPIKQRTQVEGNVRAGQFVSDFEISFMLEAAGTSRGAWNKSEVKRHSWECLTDITKHRNRIISGTHGTGRLAQIESSTTTLNTFVGKLPLGILLLRVNMLFDVYNLDSGGSSVITSRKITALADSTRTVTFDGAPASLTANQHVYIASSYGQATVPNGIAGLVDDGTLLDTIHGVSRAANPQLKSRVYRNGGVPRAMTEDLLIAPFLDLRQRNNLANGVDLFVMNTGQLGKFLILIRPERYAVVGPGQGAVGTKTLGWNSEDTLYFMADGRRVRILVSEDVHPRRIYGINRSQIRHVLLKKLGWLDQGGGSIFIQGSDSGGYKTTHVATMYALENWATFRPDSHFLIDDLLDAQLCGAAVGGPDT